MPSTKGYLTPSDTSNLACIPGSLWPPGTASSTYSVRIHGGLLTPRTTNPICHSRDLLPSGATKSTCSPRGTLPWEITRTINTREIQISKGQHKNTVYKSQGNMVTAKSRVPVRVSTKYNNTPKTHENDFKNNLMKKIEVFEEEINTPLEEIVPYLIPPPPWCQDDVPIPLLTRAPH